MSVKADEVRRDMVHSLGGVVQREQAKMGVLISFEEPTKPMRQEAASAGVYESPWGKYPRIQLLTVGELLHGKRIDYPQPAGINQTYKEAPKARKVAEPFKAYWTRSQPTRECGMATDEYKPGQEVPTSGIYKVTHDRSHALEHEVTCVKGEPFPPCKNCGEHPRFVLVHAAHHVANHELFRKW